MNQDQSTVRRFATGDIDLLRQIEKSARSRYRALQGFEPAADSPPIAAERFAVGETFVAEWRGGVAGFVLTQVLDGLSYIANISVAPDASGRGIGRLLLRAAERHAVAQSLPAVTLTTFKTPPWNGPWFRHNGFEVMPLERIGPELGSALARHAAFLDMAMRETLWKPLDQTRNP